MKISTKGRYAVRVMMDIAEHDGGEDGQGGDAVGDHLVDLLGGRELAHVLALEAALAQLGQGANVSRYKGLGEMNPQQLWDTTMDPETRVMKKVTIEDGMIADQLFSVLMGDDVEPRREFIIEHAHEVINLDV